MNEQIDAAAEATNHYETLGVEETATPEQIRLAYRRAIKICHPDHNHGDPRAAKLFHEPKLRPYLEAARHHAAEGQAAADIAANLIDSGCSYEAAWELAWQARHDQMSQRMQHPDTPARSVPLTTGDGPWHPHRNSLWEKLRYGVARIFS